jgi:hypothetical protein
MSPRVSLILASLVLACTSNDPADTDASTSGSTGTSGPTTTSATTSTSATSATSATGTTGPNDPTTAGTAAEASSAGSEDGSASEAGTAATGDGGVTFTEVYEQVIMPKACNSGYCHGGGAGGLELTDEATSYANLVDMAAASPACGQSMRVVPGSLDESILWYRVRPSALDAGNPCASKMPQGSMGLSDAEAQLVEDWISGGALE